MTGARFPRPGEYAGTNPAPEEGLRQALARSTDAELQRAASMLVAGAKTMAGAGLADTIAGELTGSAALFGWLAAVVTEELHRREVLFDGLAGPG